MWLLLLIAAWIYAGAVECFGLKKLWMDPLEWDYPTELEIGYGSWTLVSGSGKKVTSRVTTLICHTPQDRASCSLGGPFQRMEPPCCPSPDNTYLHGGASGFPLGGREFNRDCECVLDQHCLCAPKGQL